MATSLGFPLTPAPIMPTGPVLLPMPSSPTHAAIVGRVIKGGSGSGSGSGIGSGVGSGAGSGSGGGKQPGGAEAEASSASSKTSKLFKQFNSVKNKATCIQSCSSLQTPLGSCLATTTTSTITTTSATGTDTSSSSSSSVVSTSAAKATNLVLQGNCVCSDPVMLKFGNGQDVCADSCGNDDEEDYEDLRERYRDLCGLNKDSSAPTLRGMVGVWVFVCALLGAAVLG